MSIENPTRVYLIGLNGAGMRPLALAALARFFFVSGSDEKISVTDEKFYSTREIRIAQTMKQKKEWIIQSDVVVYSSAISSQHPELLWAKQVCREGRLQLLHRMEFLNDSLLDLISADPIALKSPAKSLRQVAIAGTHGKSSTTAMITWILNQSGVQDNRFSSRESSPSWSPVAVWGAKLKAYGNQGFFFESPENSQSSSLNKPKNVHQVAIYETDESDASLLLCSAQLRVLLNIDQDHQDFYCTKADYLHAFAEFVTKAQVALLNLNDAAVRSLFVELCSEKMSRALDSSNEHRMPIIIGQYICHDPSSLQKAQTGKQESKATDMENMGNKKQLEIDKKNLEIFNQAQKQTASGKVKIRIFQWHQKNGEHSVRLQQEFPSSNTVTHIHTDWLRIFNPTILNFAMMQNILLGMTTVELLAEDVRSESMQKQNLTSAVNSFPGLERRMDYVGRFQGWVCYDDYAHHPTAIRCVVAGVRQNLCVLMQPKEKETNHNGQSLHSWQSSSHSQKIPLVVIFQPHRYTRTRQYVKEFAAVLLEADVVYLLPIFAASEKNVSGICSTDILNEMKALQVKNNGLPRKPQEHPMPTVVECVDSVAECLARIPNFFSQTKTPSKEKIETGGILLTLGAGNISAQIRKIL